MKSVWILWDDGDFDTGPTVAAIYETEELAEKMLAEVEAKPHGYVYYVEEWKHGGTMSFWDFFFKPSILSLERKLTAAEARLRRRGIYNQSGHDVPKLLHQCAG